jgi:agmatine/peptidylarginine deiminase
VQFVVKDSDGGGSSGRSVAGVDWQFNAWGGHEGGLYPCWDRDQQVASTILQARRCCWLRPELLELFRSSCFACDNV